MAEPAEIQQLDDASFASLLEQARPRVLAFARRLCGSDADAEDVTQATMERAWRYRGSCDPSGRSVSWLFRTAFNSFVDLRKRRAQGPRPLDESHDRSFEPQCRTELRDEIDHALRHLAPVERLLLVAFHRDGRSVRELAELYGMSVNTIKSHLHRARRKLPGGPQQ